MKDEEITEEALRKHFAGFSVRERPHCHLCGERYLLENLEDCAGCKEDTCYACGEFKTNPATGESECICNACRKYRAGWWNGGKAMPLEGVY